MDSQGQCEFLMKKLAVIGASYLQLPLVKKAKEMGLSVICFAWEDGAVCKSEVDRFYPISIVEKEKILEVCREEKIDGIVTIASDVAAPTVAYVAEALGLTGNSFEVACRANDKFQMREAFAAANIPCPQYRLIDPDTQLLGVDWHYPLIVKPVDRSGSLAVMKVNNYDELSSAVQDAMKYSFKHQAIVEAYVEGREISVEFISYGGRHYPLQITDKVTTGAPHFVELEHHQPADLSKEMFERIYSLTADALDALGVTNGASHSEYKITSDGTPFIIEIGARMGGDFIGSDLVRLSTGYDFVKGAIDVALGKFEVPELLSQACSGVYFFCKETERLLLKKSFDNCSEIVRAEYPDRPLVEVSRSADRVGYFIYQSKKRIML